MRSPEKTRLVRPSFGRALSLIAAVTGAVTLGTVSDSRAFEPAPSRPAAPSSAEIATDNNGTWSIIGAAPENVLTQEAPDVDAVQTATAVVNGYADGLGIADPGTDLVAQPARSLDDGGSVVRFSQRIEGIPVFASGVAVRLNRDNAALSVSSAIVPDKTTTGIDLAPTIDQAQATNLARATVKRDDGVAPNEFVASTPEMNIYDPELIGGDPNSGVINGPRLVWSLTLSTPDESLRYRVLVDAVEPAVLLSFSETAHGRNRRACDYGSTYEPQVCRNEGQPAVAGRTELNRGYTMVGDAYDYFKNNFNRDSYDDQGAQIELITSYCPAPHRCPYANAFWSGAALVFGTGFASADDVVAHEFTHAVTEHEANLMYYAESGAINESMSDVFGEFIDQANARYYADPASDKWLIGEDLGDDGLLRSMKNPPEFGSPDRVLSSNYWNDSPDNYGVHINSGVSNKAAYLLTEGGTFNGQVISRLGNDKTAAIYYEALTSVLTPGSDYLDLYWGLQRACNNIIGKKGITSSDCTMVKRAVTATEMNRAPALRRTTTKECANGERTNLFTDDAESGFGNWVTSSGADRWRVTGRASQSGRYSFYAPNLGSDDDRAPFSNWMRTKAPIDVPAAGTSYLWFDHSYGLEAPWDGAVVEYSTDGRSWSDLGAAIEANGYTGLITDPSRGVLAGREAYTGYSFGFQQTRISLASVRGKRVYLRFFMGSDVQFGVEGWYIDDVNVYNCAPARANFPTGYQAITPQRLIDTRTSAGMVEANGIRPAGSVLKFDAGSLGIYEGGHTPTALNLTITTVANSGPGYVTVYPCGDRPTTSSLNTTEPQTVVVNTATVPISSSGEVCIYNHMTTHLIVDVAGYQTSTMGTTPPSRYKPLAPSRLLDTRRERGPLPAGSVYEFDTHTFDVFPSGTTPTALDLTFSIFNNIGPGHITAYPCGARPTTTVLNAYKPFQLVSNTATVPVSASGKVCVYAHMETELTIDVSGYYADAQDPTLAQYRPLVPQRVVDTRNSSGIFSVEGIRPAGSVLKFNISDLGIQEDGETPTAYDLTFAMILNQAIGHITAYPCGDQPTVATMTAASANMVIANTATIPVSANGDICVYTHPATHLTIDVTGYHYN